jgi:hypothetical protein
VGGWDRKQPGFQPKSCSRRHSLGASHMGSSPQVAQSVSDKMQSGTTCRLLLVWRDPDRPKVFLHAPHCVCRNPGVS